MDLNADSGTLPTHTTVGGPALEQDLTLSSTRCLTESGGTILLQLLEFKTHLIEAVEELHILRDAEARYEDQISKLVLEKQELEWEKESLRHQTETVANQHAESLINIKKQFQAKIRNIEEEKGKYQVSAELKDKEINNLKEELKSLQLLKYNFEKKSSELEQKLALQSRSKDSHLKQLGEVEKRFSALSRHCASVKQAHEKLEQNVDEAMKMNTKLSFANAKQEATIGSLKKELEEVRNKLIKAKMSSVRHDRTHSPTGREQRVQLLHQKLNMETDMNKKLSEENVGVRAEKQQVMRSLQHTQQLLLSQTQTVSKVEMELQTQREQHQALKQEHEVMQEKSKAMEDKVAQLMESYAASKTSWDKEKTMFQAAKKAYDELHQKHTELSSQAEVQAQHIYELEMRDSSQSLSVSTLLFPTSVEEIRGEETLNEPFFSSKLPSFGSLQHSASTQTKSPDCLEDTGAVTKLVATTGGRDTAKHHQQSQPKQPLNPSNLFTCSLNDNKPFSLYSLSGSDSSMINTHLNNSNTSYPDTDFIYSTSSASDAGLLISKGSCVSDTSTVSSPGQRSKEKSDEGNGGMSEKEQGWEGDVKQGKKNREEKERIEEQQWSREEVQGEDVKGGTRGEKRGTLMAQTTDRADRREDSQRSTEDAVDSKQPKTETNDRAEGEGTDGAEDRETTGPDTPETQIPTQTTPDTTTGKSVTQQVIDFMSTESPLAARGSSDCSQSLSQKVSGKDADSSHVSKGYGIRGEVHIFCSGEHQSVSHGPKSVIQEVQRLCRGEVQIFAQDAESLTPIHHVYEKTTEEKPSDTSASVCSSQINTAPLAAQSGGVVSTRELETTTTPRQPCNHSDITIDMKQTDEMCDTHVSEECVSARTMVEPQALPQSQETSEQERGQLKSPVADDDDDDNPSAYKKRKIQSIVDTCEHDAQEPVEISNSRDACVESMSEQNTSGPGGLIGRPHRTTPMFLKHNKVPLVITRASDLLNGSSVSGTAASSRRHQRGETADTESRVSTSSLTVSRLSWQTSPGCNRAPTSAAGPSSESDWEASCSQEREDQQSSFRAQISKIEQFLNTERLRLHKRQRTDS